ncbi:MAG: hypothetical protein IKL76_03250 [Clostridia bacterium]|nr:hypothetical protein [Clostridia bacterium]
MNKFGKMLSVALASLSVLSLASCGDKKETNDGVTEITIWTGGSSEYQMKKGSKEEEVYKYVEDLYYEEFKEKIKFNVQLLGQNMKNSMTTQVTEGTIDVVMSHVGGGDGLDDWFLGQGTQIYRDMCTDFKRYKNLSKWMTWSDPNPDVASEDKLTVNALDRVTTKDGKIVGIPSVITPYKFGILVRKDWMKACGYTDDEAEATAENLTLVNDYEEFEEMALAMKSAKNLNHAVSGAIYEVEKTGLLGAYGLDAGYYTYTKAKDENDLDVMGYGALLNPKYAEILEVESRWIHEGVLKKSPDATKVNDYEAEFIAGSTGIFLQNGTIEHLIEVARACKAQNAEAEFTVLCGLTKDDTSTAKGNMRNSVSTFMASITKNTPDVDTILNFLNWVYSSEKIYNICRYGIEGVHWINNGDGTYSYPEGYSYHNKPYSGVLTLVENQVISNLQYKEFTDVEKSWISKVRKAENYLVNDTVDYLLFVASKEKRDKHFAVVGGMSDLSQAVWGASGDYQTTPFSTQNATHMASFNKAQSDYKAGANEYNLTLYEDYNFFLAQKAENNE